MRLEELLLAFREVAPENRYLFYLHRKAGAAFSGLPRTSQLAREVQLSSTALRLLWEEAFLPLILTRERVDWLIGPTNVLPNRIRPSIHTAVIVSSLAPFTPAAWPYLRGYQRVRAELLRRLTLAAVRRADKVFIPSQETARLLNLDLSTAKLHLLSPSPPAPAVFQAAQRMIPRVPFRDRPFFVMVGDLYPYEGVEDAIRAIALVRKRGGDPRLFIYGRPVDRIYFRRLRELATRLGTDVRFFDGVQHSQALALMNLGVATLFCSRVGDNIRVPIDSMALGAPVIAADSPVTLELCGDAVAYYPPTQYGDLADHMHDVLNREHVRRFLIQRGQERARSRSWTDGALTILRGLGIRDDSAAQRKGSQGT